MQGSGGSGAGSCFSERDSVGLLIRKEGNPEIPGWMSPRGVPDPGNVGAGGVCVRRGERPSPFSFTCGITKSLQSKPPLPMKVGEFLPNM